ncbi:AfsA-related hotdog domain-containing protein [Nocardia sp. NPDC051756]|uniref:AfsA-related hotdog domain-containing protein n=1 Tax=Nocardia sp. NPDC051756 TaxID=3154751 RepID=UPI00341C31B4
MTKNLLDTGPPRRDGLTFDQTVPRTLAHRRALGEVYVADTVQVGPDEFLAAIQLPRAHSLWFDRTVDYHDPLSTIEAIRQAMLVVGQRYGQVPADTPLSLQRMAFSVEDLSAFRDDRRAPLEGIVRIHSDQGRPGDYFVDTAFEATLTIDSALALTVRGSGIVFTRDAYDGMRLVQRAERATGVTGAGPVVTLVEPVRVGRRDHRNVVLATVPHDDGVVLVVDQSHPSFFDHPYDHVPGPLLLEAFRQAAILAGGRPDTPVVTAAEIEFTGFAELDAIVECTTEADAESGVGGTEVVVDFHQFGKQVAHGRIELSPYPADSYR